MSVACYRNFPEPARPRKTMNTPRHQADLPRVREQLLTWIARQASEEAMQWLRTRHAEIEGGAPASKCFMAFSGAPRRITKETLALGKADLQEADALRPGWNPSAWSVDEAARALLILSFPAVDENAYVGMVEQVFSTADVRESAALYRMLPLYPFPERFRARAAEGIRSNMTSVFQAVAHHNPYPSEYFDEGAWNQMVLKALFTDSPLYKVSGLDARVNPSLARMLVDYAHERWAAGRTVSPELWRPVGPFAADGYLHDLERVLTGGEEMEQEAAVLALADANTAAATELLAGFPVLKQRIGAGELNWESFSRNRIRGSA